jgi:hypothetical protein
MMESFAGTTPLPLSSAGSPVRVWFNDAECDAQEAEADMVSSFEARRFDDVINGSLVQTNRKFVVYVVKTGMLRIMDRNKTGAKGLIREHSKQRITDVQFFNQDDMLASVGGPTLECQQSSLIVSRLSQQGPIINYQILLEFKTEHFAMLRIVWHPFDVNVSLQVKHR